jgi:signal transduction histidine kinase
MLAYLLENGLESLAGGSGTIEISTYFDARSWLVLAIRDTGCGMSQEVLRRATEPFFSTKAEHAGVGLTIAQAIWRRNRGALSIESQPGEGTTVRLSMVPSTPPAAVKAPARRPGAPERGH